MVGAACGGDGPDEPTERASTTTGATSGSPPTSSPPTTEVTCGAVAVPAGATNGVEVAADVDGDGRADAVRSHQGPDGWHLQVEVAPGRGADLPYGPEALEGIRVIGGADVDGDGDDEIWVQTGRGASALVLGLAVYTDCALARVALPSLDEAAFPVGGSVGTAAGLECAAADPSAHLTAYTATNTGDSTYEVVAVEHRLEGGTLHEVAHRTETATLGDDLFTRATSFRCGDLGL